MKNLGLGLLLLLALLAQSCLLSLFPLHTPQTTITLPGVVGTWKDKDGLKLTVAPARSEDKSYFLTLSGKGKRFFYSGHLVKLQDLVILDLLPQSDLQQTELEVMGELAYSLPTHNFLRCQLHADTMRLAFVNPDFLDSLATAQPALLSQLKLENDQSVLTSSTAQLQSFFLNYGQNPAAFKEISVFYRKK